MNVFERENNNARGQIVTAKTAISRQTSVRCQRIETEKSETNKTIHGNDKMIKELSKKNVTRAKTLIQYVSSDSLKR